MPVSLFRAKLGADIKAGLVTIAPTACRSGDVCRLVLGDSGQGPPGGWAK
jgi:hypothetical protein